MEFLSLRVQAWAVNHLHLLHCHPTSLQPTPPSTTVPEYAEEDDS
ncbi:hypothetical protein QN277_018292 [Acacia crassicarpa]|uniref:Uncharacterized protein n=1 Tax=Acacia crassicarpa TaxID=499986 RepID=A0AAE1JVG2_9FABA|nr:hypothetical protein QN277_018292 [Acacia crassicarpa]